MQKGNLASFDDKNQESEECQLSELDIHSEVMFLLF